MSILLIAAIVIAIAVAAYFAVRLARSPVPVATEAEIEARQLDEGMIVGDPIPIGSADDVGVVTVVPTDADASTQADADAFGESTGTVEPLPPHGSPTAADSAARTSAGDIRMGRTDPKRPRATDQPKPPADSSATSSTESNSASATTTPAAVDGVAPQATTAAPTPAPATTLTARRHDIRWARRFEPADASFDDATRLSLLKDLGIVRAPWGVPLLAQAYEEEPDAEHRRAALRSLAAYRHPDTQGTFDVALHSDDEEERTIAEHALTALQIRAALPS